MSAKASRQKTKKKKDKRRPYWSGGRLAALGFLALVPPALLLLVDLMWHAGRTNLYERLDPWHETILGGFLVVFFSLICPLVTTACGLGLIRDKGFKLVSCILLLAGPLTLAAKLLTRPS